MKLHMFQLTTLIYVALNHHHPVAASTQPTCTPCDKHGSPAEYGDPTALTICQPGILGEGDCHGDYKFRGANVPDICQKIKETECFTLDDIQCSDDSNCLKWGHHAYAGVALIPAGVIVEGYTHTSGSWSCSGDPHTTASGGESGSRWNFWDYDWRVNAFQLRLMDDYKCIDNGAVVMEFTNYVGEWVLVTTGASMSITATRSWQETESNTISNSFTVGLSQTSKFSDPVGLSEVSRTVSAEWSTMSSHTLSLMQRDTTSVTCSSMPCPNGNLFQWKVSGDRVFDNASHVIRQCKFACVPSYMPGGTKPRCPPNYCDDLLIGCQCCNARYVKEGADQPCEDHKNCETQCCVPYTKEACLVSAEAAGLNVQGTPDFGFDDAYHTKGCYAYSANEYERMAFYGYGTDNDEMMAPPSDPVKYRPQGYDCKKCVPYSIEACRKSATAAGLTLGSQDFKFADTSYPYKGCYAYSNAKYGGHAFYGLGGNSNEIRVPISNTNDPERYRPQGYDCQECVKYSVEACRKSATAAGLTLGSQDYYFADTSYPQKGCYAYSSTHPHLGGHAFYGLGGTENENKVPTTRDPHSYRPDGYDCGKVQRRVLSAMVNASKFMQSKMHKTINSVHNLRRGTRSLE